MDGTMIMVNDQRLVDAEALAMHCGNQEVLDYLARLALQSPPEGIAAYNEQGEPLERAHLVPDENDRYSKFFVSPDELGQYFGEGRAEETDRESDLELAYSIERVLDQI